jgi:hypothetical protein
MLFINTKQRWKKSETNLKGIHEKRRFYGITILCSICVMNVTTLFVGLQ